MPAPANTWRGLHATDRSSGSEPAAIERQQLAENLVVGNARRPTVRGSHRRVKGFVCVGEPVPSIYSSARTELD